MSCICLEMLFILLTSFFFSSRRRHTRCLSDWSSDVCSSDLRPLLRELVGKYGYADIAAELDRRDGWPLEEDFLTGGMPPDDYIHCQITQKQDWLDLYATPYYFGCETDDRMNAVAFGKAMPLGARFNAISRSDIGHFDVVDMRDPL